jgi:hypothetical protein
VSGTRNVTVVLTRASVIAGKVLVDEADASARIRVNARRPDDSVEAKRTFAAAESSVVKPDGSFQLPGVRPGQCDLVFTMDGRREKRVIESVALRAGETAADPRLAAIDLRGAFPTVVPNERKRD